MKGKILLVLSILFFLISLLLFSLHYLFNSPLNPSFKGYRLVFIRHGMSFKQVVDLLKKEEILKEPYKFLFVARLLGACKKIKAGEYRISGRWSSKRLLEVLTSGKVVLHKVEISEGLTWWQVGKIVASSGLTSFENFKKCVFDQKLLKKLHIPLSSAEGFLFPETYLFSKKDGIQTAKEVVEKMVKEFWEKTDKYLWHGKKPDPQRLAKIVILASMIEKETSIPSERPIIAGVFLNRLKKNMPLQCDPTVIYGIGPEFNGNLTKRDLKNKNNPYNTYVHKGLPPGPICSPGLDSLKAALHPAKHNYLYFVAKGDGTHIFSKTLKEHNIAVRKYILKK